MSGFVFLVAVELGCGLLRGLCVACLCARGRALSRFCSGVRGPALFAVVCFYLRGAQFRPICGVLYCLMFAKCCNVFAPVMQPEIIFHVEMENPINMQGFHAVQILKKQPAKQIPARGRKENTRVI